MKKILTIFILSLCCDPSQSEDIKDFEIDGMSVKSSLLEYFGKIISKNKTFYEQAKGNKEYAKLEENLQFMKMLR